MRRALLALSLIAGSASAADATYGEHGMALFGGKEGLYASHLPMFHAPHDYQVILQVHVADTATDAALRSRLDGKTALWTIAPEKFELSRLSPTSAAPLKQFKADLVLGHFEQGGKTQFPATTIVVDKVLMYRQLSPAQKTNAGAGYMQIGSGRQRYLVKRIDSRPDFDHIVSYAAANGASTADITLNKQALQQPTAQSLADALHVPASAIRGTVYFYTDDLK
ncbi:hypothetical protein D0T25_08900 [Duganella sp. BJB488]|uniref:hypothetical protein n=1 Tax=unclassified Duganella TaxID=2636909 RepID=UPI000E3476DC|nr:MULTISPECIES: hypothetical protein [unclassified Duganella]RFP22771.1 hypothetical protein D0T26_06950 [Duganella sp. BJB489]RFP25155.1 hypothetical protein D0T25_08900 [Duganella sp. BJB488]RFP33768.1 hypothetical protein D0T24_15330 [Duganella sp. BJB480]